MTRQTGHGQSTPSLATRKILQGHHSDGPAEGAGVGRGGRAEGFHQEPWPRCVPAAVPRPSGSQVCWGLNRAQLGEAGCPSHWGGGHLSPPGTSKIIGEHLDGARRDRGHPTKERVLGAGRLRGGWGWEEGGLAAPELPG